MIKKQDIIDYKLIAIFSEADSANYAATSLRNFINQLLPYIELSEKLDKNDDVSESFKIDYLEKNDSYIHDIVKNHINKNGLTSTIDIIVRNAKICNEYNLTINGNELVLLGKAGHLTKWNLFKDMLMGLGAISAHWTNVEMEKVEKVLKKQ